MRQIRYVSTALLAAAVCGSGFAQEGGVAHGGQMQVGRYTTTTAVPAQDAAQPLAAYVRVSFPRQTVSTVGDALRHALLRTGWRLVEPSSLEPQARDFLTLPLPDSQRTLGPYRARELLTVLTGPSWAWHEDPLKRQVWFTNRAANPTGQADPVTVTPVATAVVEPQETPAAEAERRVPLTPIWIN